MDPNFWVRMHGGSTHFPIALVLAASLFDLAGFFSPARSYRRDLHAAAFYSLILGALVSFGAILSGLVMTRWDLIGHDLEAKHHAFVWPAIALLIALAIWRVVVRDRASRRAFAFYLATLFVTSALMVGAGYWGGEMVITK